MLIDIFTKIVTPGLRREGAGMVAPSMGI